MLDSFCISIISFDKVAVSVEVMSTVLRVIAFGSGIPGKNPPQSLICLFTLHQLKDIGGQEQEP